MWINSPTVAFLLRVTEAQRDLLDRAAASKGMPRSLFVTQAAVERAERDLLEMMVMDVDGITFEGFKSKLDGTP
ncbi:MAG: hypothetical protein RL026_851 [Pseudomonadota bacterium]|jgi:uncharacterized protein (DUF1778 family)